MDILFTYPHSFTSAIVALITLILLHCGFLALEIFLIFWYGKADDDRFQYGIITKISTLLGIHMTASMLIVLATDFALSDWKTGIITGFSMSTFYKITFVMKEIVLYGTITYTNFLYDADNDKGYFRPWAKALIWTGIHCLSVLLFYFLWYAILIGGNFNRVVCETLFKNIEELTVYYGDSACIPKCQIYWQADPTICLQYETVIDKTNYSMTQAFLMPNLIISYFMLMIFFMIGLIYIPYRAWFLMIEAKKAPITNETDLKVAQAEVLEMARSMKLIGGAIGARRLALSKKKFSLKPSPLWAQVKLHFDYNKYIHGCFLLFEQFEGVEFRQRMGLTDEGPTYESNLHVSYVRFGFETLFCACFFFYVLIFRIGASARNDTAIAPSQNPMSMLLAMCLDCNFFPLPAIMLLALLLSVLGIAIAGYRALLNVFPIDRPLRPMRKGQVRIRDILSMTTIALYLCSGLIVFQAIHLDYYDNGSWLHRNFFSVLQFYQHDLNSKSIVEILALVMMFLWLGATFYIHPKKMPWGLTADSDPLAKAAELSTKWEKGESTSRIGEKFARSGDAMNKFTADAKSKARQAAFDDVKPNF